MFILIMMVPLFLALLVGSLAVNYMQIGFLFSIDPLKPNLKKINIFDPTNYKKLVNVKAVMRLCLGITKICVIALVIAIFIYFSMNRMVSLTNGVVLKTLIFLFKKAFYIGITVALILFILGVVDYLFQRWKFMKDLRMSKQEVKDERKQMEGDLQLKSKIRSMMQAYTQSRMKSNVKHSDVVIANPTHYAIAVKYTPNEMTAPLCLAKGARKMAVSIKELAKEHNVPIVENPVLARSLFKVVEVGSYIPPGFYHSIAEVLAYVYTLNEKSKDIEKK
jgi:flagellar biosynthesis protein FlhB